MNDTVPPTTIHAADALVDAIARTGAPICVGLDPVVERIPGADASSDVVRAVAAIRSFSLHVLDAVAGVVPCVKLQSACFERYGPTGVAAADEVIAAARERDLQVVLDAKRGDIGISAAHYAAAAFERSSACADWITISPYLGDDAMRPFVRDGHGAFALVRTSNPGGTALQGSRLADGRTVAELVAGIVAELGRESIGASGFSALGAVVGATHADDVARLRAAMPEQMLLVPGYGAQGGGADDIRACFHPGGRGAIITASRSIIYPEVAAGADWSGAVRAAAQRMADDVRAVAGVR